MLVRRITLIFIYLQIVQAMLCSDFNVQHYVQQCPSEPPFPIPFSLLSDTKKAVTIFGNHLILRAVDED